MKEPVFQFYVTLTKEDYIRYNRTIVWRNKRTKWTFIITFVLLVLSCISLLFCYWNSSYVTIYDCLPLLLLFLLVFILYGITIACSILILGIMAVTSTR